MCDSSAALRAERHLALSEGIFGGISSGAVIFGAVRVAERMDRGTVVALLADGGWKYLSTGLWSKAPETFREDMAGKLWW